MLCVSMLEGKVRDSFSNHGLAHGLWCDEVTEPKKLVINHANSLNVDLFQLRLRNIQIKIYSI